MTALGRAYLHSMSKNTSTLNEDLKLNLKSPHQDKHIGVQQIKITKVKLYKRQQKTRLKSGFTRLQNPIDYSVTARMLLNKSFCSWLGRAVCSAIN
jgi:hypothetical protein